MNKDILTQVLNLTCPRTKKAIQVGEVVSLHNWGMEGGCIGYGSFEWDEQERNFWIKPCEELNIVKGVERQSFDFGAYDQFRTMPEKLTEEEKDLLG